MYCAKCGAFLADDARECSSCGNPVRIRPEAGKPAAGRRNREDLPSQNTEAFQDDFTRLILEDEKIMDPVYFEDAAGNPDVEAIIRIARGENEPVKADRAHGEDLPSRETASEPERASSNKAAGKKTASGSPGRTAGGKKSAPHSQAARSSLTAEEERKEAEAARKRQEAAIKRRKASAAKRKKAAASGKRKAAAARPERPVYASRSTGPAGRRGPKKPSMFDGVSRSMKAYVHAREEADDERRMRKHLARAARYYESLDLPEEWIEETPGRTSYARTGFDETGTGERGSGTGTDRRKFESGTDRGEFSAQSAQPSASMEAAGEFAASEEIKPAAKALVRPAEEKTVDVLQADVPDPGMKAEEAVKKAAPAESVPAEAEAAARGMKAEQAVRKTAPAESVPAEAEAAARGTKAEQAVSKEILSETAPAEAAFTEHVSKAEEAVKKAAPADTGTTEYEAKEKTTAKTAAAGKVYASAAAVEEITRLTEELRPRLEEEIRAGMETEIRAGMEQEMRARLETEIRASLEKEYAEKAGSGRASGADPSGEAADQYNGLFSEEDLRIEAARRLRRYYDAEQEEVNAAFGLFGLTRAMTVRLATFFLIVVLSVIYVLGRGDEPDVSYAPSSSGAPGDAVSPDSEESEESPEEEENTDSSVPTGGGEFGGESSEEE